MAAYLEVLAADQADIHVEGGEAHAAALFEIKVQGLRGGWGSGTVGEG